MQRAPDQSRKERLAQALKENLKRRKAQARARATGGTVPGAQAPDAVLRSGPENLPQSGLKTAPKCR
jgi:hypothetical protein